MCTIWPRGAREIRLEIIKPEHSSFSPIPLTFAHHALPMTDHSTAPATATSAPNPQQELDALVAIVAALSQTSLAMAKHCLDIQSAYFLKHYPFFL